MAGIFTDTGPRIVMVLNKKMYSVAKVRIFLIIRKRYEGKNACCIDF